MWVMWWVAPLSMTQSVVRGGHGGEDDPEKARATPGPAVSMDEPQLLPSDGGGHTTNATGLRIGVRSQLLIGVRVLSQAPGTATGDTDEGEGHTTSVDTKLVQGGSGEVSGLVPLDLQGEKEQGGRSASDTPLVGGCAARVATAGGGGTSAYLMSDSRSSTAVVASRMARRMNSPEAMSPCRVARCCTALLSF